MKIFVAAWPTPAVIEVLGQFRQSIVVQVSGDPPSRADGSVRWTSEDQWHVTLAFLGEVDAADLGAVVRGTSEAATRMAGPLPVTAGPATERLGRGVLCLPVAGLDELAAAVRDEVMGLGDHQPEPGFIGHLTVARGRGGRPVPRALVSLPVSAQWEVETIAVVSSVTGQAGATYTNEAVIPVGSEAAGRPVGRRP